MFSLTLWIAVFICEFFVVSVGIAWAARAVGSSRGQFRNGLLTTLTLVGVGITMLLLQPAPRKSDGAVFNWAVAIGWTISGLAMNLVVLRGMFELSLARALAPFAMILLIAGLFLTLVLGVLRPRVSHSYIIPGVGMTPTLEPGDRFFVNKLARPRRWDIVAYWNSEHVLYCKRLVGLPGERLRFQKGQLYVNDQVQTAPAVLTGRLTAWLHPMGQPYRTRYDDGETIRLGPTEMFFIGDNVAESVDSRFEGPSHSSDVEGVVDLQYWPMSKFAVKR